MGAWAWRTMTKPRQMSFVLLCVATIFLAASSECEVNREGENVQVPGLLMNKPRGKNVSLETKHWQGIPPNDEELLYNEYEEHEEFRDQNDAMKEFADLLAHLERQVRDYRNSMNDDGLPFLLPHKKEVYTRQAFLNLVPLYLPDAGKVNAECRRDLLAIYRSISMLEDLVKNGTMWPLRLVDSWGKFADGMLVGNLVLMGFFKECLSISVAQEDADFQGQYCFINYGPNKTGSSMVGQWLDNQSAHDHDLRVPIVSTSLPNAILSSYATCMPSTCTAAELKETISTALEQGGYKLNVLECQVEDPQEGFSSVEIFGIVFFSVLLAVLITATALDTWDQHFNGFRLQTGPAKYLMVFSVSQNLRKLFHLDTTKNPSVISCLHGIRFLSICWVVLGHQYIYSASLASNPSEILDILKPTAFQMISNGDLSVDTFFFMSGTLVAFGLLREVTRTGKFNAAMYYFHRVIRLLPPIAITDAFLATLSGLLVTGPLANLYRIYYLKGCRHSWWMDVSLMTNLFFPYLEQMGKTNEGACCLPHCWYVGVDTQLYILVPLILLPIYYRKNAGLKWLALWTLASLVVPAVIIGVYDLWPASMMSLDSDASLQYNYKVYLMPWCRASPYFVGLWIGYILHRTKESPQLKNLLTWQVWTGWATATAVALAVVFGISRYNYIGPDVPKMSLAEAIFYGGMHRAAWAAVLAWVVLACHWGYGGPINWFLSHPSWQPLSRLTYCIYLTSLPIQYAVLYSTMRPQYYTNLAKIQETCGILLIVFLVSIALTLVSESPILRLEKLLLRPPAPKESQREHDRSSGNIASSPSVSQLVSSSSQDEETSDEAVGSSHEKVSPELA